MRNTWIKIGLFTVVIVILNVILMCIFDDYAAQLFSTMKTSEWWAKGMLGWVIFSIFIMLGIRAFAWVEDWPHRNATLNIYESAGKENHIGEVKLSVSEAKSILDKNHAGWQIIKSFLSTYIRMTTFYYEGALDEGWLVFEGKRGRFEIIIYRDKIPGTRYS